MHETTGGRLINTVRVMAVQRRDRRGPAVRDSNDMDETMINDTAPCAANGMRGGA